MLKHNQQDITSYPQKYFRPSCLKALNLRFSNWEFFAPYYNKTQKEIQVPTELTRTPKIPFLTILVFCVKLKIWERGVAVPLVRRVYRFLLHIIFV